LVQLRDPVLALDFDLAAAARLLHLQPVALAQAEINPGEPIQEPAGTRKIHW
jgi:hypothetical protein